MNCQVDAKTLQCRRCGAQVSSVAVSRNCSFNHKESCVVPQLPSGGPGTELKRLLARVGITASPDCACNARAAEMDRQGVDWCEANVETIVGWLREQATARGLPFFKAAARLLVRRAIANARK